MKIDVFNKTIDIDKILWIDSEFKIYNTSGNSKKFQIEISFSIGMIGSLLEIKECFNYSEKTEVDNYILNFRESFFLLKNKFINK